MHYPTEVLFQFNELKDLKNLQENFWVEFTKSKIKKSKLEIPAKQKFLACLMIIK